MSTTTTYTGVRIVDMPDLGTFTGTSSLVGEAAGSGRFSAAGLSGYFLPLNGGTITTDLTVGNSLTVDGAFFAGGDATLEKTLAVGGTGINYPALGGVFVTHHTAFGYDGSYIVGAADGTYVGQLVTKQYVDANPAGYQTAAQVAATVGNYLPLAGGTLSGPLSGPTANFTTANATTYNAANNGAFNCLNTASALTLQIFSIVATGAATFRNTLSGVDLIIDDAGGSFIYSGGSGVAYKTGGGSWTAPSDARIKDVRGEYETGLAEVLALRPVRYVYKGNFRASEHDEVSPHAQAAKAGTEFIGLVAQEAETVMPEVVRQTEGWIDGARVADTRMLDPSALVYALVNAVRELAGRVGELEALVTTRETPTRGA